MISFLLLFSFFSFAQQKITVRGTVVSDKNVPLPGVSVKVEGEAIGTATESNGSFTLKVNKGAVLILSFIGYEEKQIKINNEKNIGNIQMVPVVTTKRQINEK